MTEDEARKKVCPEGAGERVTIPNTTASTGAHRYRTTCVASDCMWWRWSDDIEGRYQREPPEGEGWTHMEAIGGLAHWARASSTGHGYCGAAGPP